jgi:hypothetical protein
MTASPEIVERRSFGADARQSLINENALPPMRKRAF